MSSLPFIQVTNSRVHNLKNVSVKIPKNKLTVITGLSGSGKSSLAFDTIYAEGQRRYAESLNAYARQFMEVADKPDVDEIKGLSPTIAIDQKNTSQNPRSTVGTTTEIYDLLRLLFSRIGIQYCPDCNQPAKKYTAGEITEEARGLGRSCHPLLILSPLVISQKDINPKDLLTRIEQSGCEWARINGALLKINQIKNCRFDKEKKYDVEILIAKINDVKKQNLMAAVDKAVDLSNGFAVVADEETGEEKNYSLLPVCGRCGRKFNPIEPRTFSFNSPYGACPRCTGLGYTMDIDPELVIPNTRLTLSEGAIQPWTRIVGNQSHYQKLLEVVAEARGFSINTQVKDLPKAVMDDLFYGTDGKTYIINGKETNFEGIIPNLTQRHAETDSEYIRKEIECYMREKICPVCRGKKLKNESLAVKVNDWTIADCAGMTVEEARQNFGSLLDRKKTEAEKNNNLKTETAIIQPIAKELCSRLDNLLQVGLYYIALDRSITTLSGGEAQRIRLSTQLSTGLTDVIYILDEPSIGLHPKDNNKLIDTLKNLCQSGNTVIVVEHDEAMIKAADYVIDMGPGAGETGGEVVAVGAPALIKRSKKSLTGQYLAGREKIKPPTASRKGNKKNIEITGAKAFNLKNIDVKIPLGRLVCVTGVSGSGKSSLVNHILSRALHKKFYRAKADPAEYKDIKGVNNIDKVITIDQRPIGRTPRSNPATYTGVFTAIRDLYTNVPEARMRGLDVGVFSFNVKGGGRCEACSGDGYTRIPMQFLTDVYVECGECSGRRYNQEALEIHYRQKDIADVLTMSVDEACRFFNDANGIANKLNILREVGLGYVKLGQPATTLSGGEAQRIKLATELSRRSTGKTLYILDEPTVGLHFDDIKRLLGVLHRLVDKGNTVLIIEHNLDVIKCADWVIDLGPEGGKRGGEVVAEGAPKDIAKAARSWTGRYLKEVLKK